MEFTTANGEKLEGVIVHQYPAFEGGMRYVLATGNGAQYRCIKDENGNLIELVI